MNKPIINSPEAGKARRPLIYVVDDEAMLLELARVILEPLDYQILTFRDPAAALEAFAAAQPPPDLIITDFAMHQMNGMALIGACRRIQPKQKVLLVSGTIGPEIFHDSPIKPDRFLGKPYHPHQLIGFVRLLLGD